MKLVARAHPSAGIDLEPQRAARDEAGLRLAARHHHVAQAELLRGSPDRRRSREHASPSVLVTHRHADTIVPRGQIGGEAPGARLPGRARRRRHPARGPRTLLPGCIEHRPLQAEICRPDRRDFPRAPGAAAPDRPGSGRARSRAGWDERPAGSLGTPPIKAHGHQLGPARERIGEGVRNGAAVGDRQMVGPERLHRRHPDAQPEFRIAPLERRQMGDVDSISVWPVDCAASAGRTVAHVEITTRVPGAERRAVVEEVRVSGARQESRRASLQERHQIRVVLVPEARANSARSAGSSLRRARRSRQQERHIVEALARGAAAGRASACFEEERSRVLQVTGALQRVRAF